MSRSALCSTTRLAAAGALLLAFSAPALRAQESWSVYISVDMEGLAGIGVPAMVQNGGKDYDVGRRLMTREIRAVVAGIRAAADERGIPPVRIVVNDSHGGHDNALIEQFPDGIEYVQGSLKPLGMVAELDDGFDAVIYLGYHARAGTRGFLAHTGSGLVRDLRIDGVPSGEGEMNAAFAGALGVPVVLVSGDSAYVAQARETYAGSARAVVTKTAVTAEAAHLRPVDVVHAELEAEARAAMLDLAAARPWRLDAPYTVEMTVDHTTHVDVAVGIPGVERVGPLTVRFQGDDMRRAYALIRILYRFLSV